MRVVYDSSSKIAGISIVPFSRLGPERWFDNYAIASYYPWDISDLSGSPKVYSISSLQHQQGLKKSTGDLLEQPGFRSILANSLKGYDIHTYKAVKISSQSKELPVRFNGNDPILREKIENKVEFRKLFSQKVRMPNYEVYSYEELHEGSVSVTKLLQGRDAVILQDELLSDGKGTFLLRSEADLQEALVTLRALPAGKRCVVSELIENKHERSIQACVTRYGIFVGPLQKQIIADPLLANLSIPGSAKFCGAEIASRDRFADAHSEVASYAETIGQELQAMGYKGIFGMDCLVNDDGDVFVLEVNPRLTGVTPLLTMLWEEGCIPFYLLHILELAGLEYKLENVSPERRFRDGSMMILHAPYDQEMMIKKLPQSGLYDRSGQLLSRCVRLKAGVDGTLWQQHVPDGTAVKPGERLLAAFTNGRSLDDMDCLVDSATESVEAIIRTLVVEPTVKDGQ